MKKEKASKTLVLCKTTIANLEQKDLSTVKGGYYETELMGGCTTWHPICFTLPAYKCQTQLSICRPCEFTQFC
jgi:hypothetical protein